MLDSVISRGRLEMALRQGAPSKGDPANSNPADLMGARASAGARLSS